ncbi:TrmB family transcriptional regulator [Candidatus Uhrbacteria bacterium]|nr:TrmB family transcriptional regulator [Candidatus Uhrbacteria bacterium]
MNQEQTLQNLGLSKLETATYLASLKLGGAQASALAKEIGIKRTSVYDILSSLTRKGFVTTYFKKSKRFYYPQKPHRVATLFEKKLEAFTELIPHLQSIEKTEIQAFGLRFLQTKEELEQFYVNVLKEYKGQSYEIISSAPTWQSIDEAFFVKFRHDRAKAKIKTRLLLSSESALMNPTDKALLRDFRYLPEGYKFRCTIDIFRDQVLIVSPDLTALAVVIAVPVMVDIFKSIFEMLWDFVDEK